MLLGKSYSKNTSSETLILPTSLEAVIFLCEFKLKQENNILQLWGTTDEILRKNITKTLSFFDSLLKSKGLKGK